VRNCHIKNNACNGVTITVAANKTTLESCTISGNGQYGVFVHGSDVDIQQCTITENNDGGVLLVSFGRATIMRNTISSNGRGPGSLFRWRNGVSLLGGEIAVIQDNVIEENGYAGVVMTGETEAEIWNNTFRRNSWAGIMLNTSECNPFAPTGFWGSVRGGRNNVEGSLKQVCPSQLAFLTTAQGGVYR
jgi:parallel beta-helix repeat protein